jgi:PrtD family type I secretion system ABC transporter
MAGTRRKEDGARSDIVAALRSCKKSIVATGLFSGVINILMLTGSVFMLQVYDRVLASRSVPTLVALFLIVAMLYVFMAALDMIRSRVLLRIGQQVDETLHERIFQAVTLVPLQIGRKADDLLPVRDLDQLRQFVTGPGPAVLFDVPWVPFYIAVVFLFHYWLGVAALCSVIILAALAYLNERVTQEPMQSAGATRTARNTIASASQRNSEAVAAMGMGRHLARLWTRHHLAHLKATREAGDVASGVSSATKAFRMFTQSAILAIGAYLVIRGQATPGVMIASSIITSRALAPIEQALGQWRGFAAARLSYGRLDLILGALRDRQVGTELPRPHKEISVEAVTVVPPGTTKPAVSDVSFRLHAGDGLGIIGPSAAGKSSLTRAIVGAWTPARGKVRFDGAAIEQWDRYILGRYIGYLPQDIELFDGSIAENIARFDPDKSDAAVLEATRVAGVHELILRLPEGYDTVIGEGGMNLSAGQRQRVGLARALYGDPFLVVLDEPNSNLDQEGEAALTSAIKAARERGAIVIVIAHRPSALNALDTVMMMNEGRVTAFGPKDEVLEKVLTKPAPVSRIQAISP